MMSPMLEPHDAVTLETQLRRRVSILLQPGGAPAELAATAGGYRLTPWFWDDPAPGPGTPSPPGCLPGWPFPPDCSN